MPENVEQPVEQRRPFFGCILILFVIVLLIAVIYTIVVVVSSRPEAIPEARLSTPAASFSFATEPGYSSLIT